MPPATRQSPDRFHFGPFFGSGSTQARTGSDRVAWRHLVCAPDTYLKVGSPVKAFFLYFWPGPLVVRARRSRAGGQAGAPAAERGRTSLTPASSGVRSGDGPAKNVSSLSVYLPMTTGQGRGVAGRPDLSRCTEPGSGHMMIDGVSPRKIAAARSFEARPGRVPGGSVIVGAGRKRL
jgi:hypothetical protein